MSDAAAAPVRRLLERAVRAGLAPGLVAGWWLADRGKTAIVPVGRAEALPEPRPVTADTWFDLASLTKPLAVGTLSLLALRDGAIRLDTRVGEVLPELVGAGVEGCTIGRLLTHTSGLPAWAPLYATGAGPSGVVDSIARLPVGEAATEVVYSCPGFILLGLMLARRLGAGLDVLLADRVLRPLGLADDLGFTPDRRRPVAAGALVALAEAELLAKRGLDPSLVPPPAPAKPDDGNARFLGGVAGNAGLFGTMAGVLGMARAWLEPGLLLTAEEIALATADHTPGLAQARGLGWQLAATPGCSAGPALSPGAFGHTGFAGASLWIDPTRGAALALLGNRVHPAHRPTDLHPLRRRFHETVIDRLG
ncbi:MAG: beta-lactamase family protein [Thermoanaerobaculales bacterium]|jgi:CubicO group peptidase (beta-lactamase class C family)|nr:beta-lactamase family protein [Thermoanaerobaculales bacterium]